MYHYMISDDEYSDYKFTMLYHEVSFNKKQFCMMYNRAVTELGGAANQEEIVEKLIELFDFKLVEVKYEINACYDKHQPLKDEMMEDENETFICQIK